MEYTTRGGYLLHIGRIPRQRIDQFTVDHPMPEPPMRTVEVWGDISEEVPDYNDPEYQRIVIKYYDDTSVAQLKLIADAVQIISDDYAIDDLRTLGLAKTKTSLLTFLTQDTTELQSVVEEVFYQSTVTPRGVMEAAKLFGVKWHGRPVNPFTIPKSGAIANAVYGDRVAARWNGYIDWNVFCELPGPRQSEIVALYRIDNRLQTLMSQVKGK